MTEAEPRVLLEQRQTVRTAISLRQCPLRPCVCTSDPPDLNVKSIIRFAVHHPLSSVVIKVRKIAAGSSYLAEPQLGLDRQPPCSLPPQANRGPSIHTSGELSLTRIYNLGCQNMDPKFGEFPPNHESTLVGIDLIHVIVFPQEMK